MASTPGNAPRSGAARPGLQAPLGCGAAHLQGTRGAASPSSPARRLPGPVHSPLLQGATSGHVCLSPKLGSSEEAAGVVSGTVATPPTPQAQVVDPGPGADRSPARLEGPSGAPTPEWLHPVEADESRGEPAERHGARGQEACSGSQGRAKLLPLGGLKDSKGPQLLRYGC